MKPVNTVPDLKNKEAFDILEKIIAAKKICGIPFVIGITGVGGAGKTTFGNNISDFYGSENCISIDLDDYLLSRVEREKLGKTGYDPEANKLKRARENIRDLVNKKPVIKPRYDHSTGKVIGDEEIQPRELIIIEGVTTLYEELRSANDVSFFLNASEETQIQSRIERDVKRRGYTIEQAMELFEVLKPLYARLIAPTMDYASIVFDVGMDYVMHPVKVKDSLRELL